MLLAGCAQVEAAPDPGAPSAESEPMPDATVVAYPMPDLGPSPAPAVLDPEGTEKLRLEEQDRQWESVTITYPDATRPADPFQQYRDSIDSVELTDCFAAAGLQVDIGTTADGSGRTGISVSPEDESQAISAYECWAAYPSTPIAPMTTEQLDYLYSYLTQYLVPCYEANGVTVPEAPPRDDFVSNWPDQGWFPSTGEARITAEKDQAINETCVHPA
jgi:hypothetical protein